MLHPPLGIQQVFISSGHNFFGRARQLAGTHSQIGVWEARLWAGRGIEGDRYLDYKNNYKGQITFFDQAVYQELCRTFQIKDKSPGVFRRNVIISGFDLNQLIGQKFELQGLEFEGTEECRPCAWMNHAFAPGAYEALRSKGGLRARILSDGVLRCSDPQGTRQP